MPIGLAFALVALTALSLGAAAALGWLYFNAPDAPKPLPEELRAAMTKLSALLEEERASMRRDFAAALEEASEIGETVNRHRQRIDAAEQRRKQRTEQVEEAPKQLTIMDVHRAARAAGKL